MKKLCNTLIFMLMIYGASAEAHDSFPGIGHTYLVDFKDFVVELNFQSDTQLRYTGVRPDGSHGSSETVVIEITPLRKQEFLVTWTEKDKTTVVHVEDFQKKVIFTNITSPDSSFQKFKGSMTLLK